MTSAQTTPNKTARATEKTRKQTGPRAQTRPQAPTDDVALKWVSARLETQLVRDIDAHAEKAGITRSDAIRTAWPSDWRRSRSAAASRPGAPSTS